MAGRLSLSLSLSLSVSLSFSFCAGRKNAANLVIQRAVTTNASSYLSPLSMLVLFFYAAAFQCFFSSSLVGKATQDKKNSVEGGAL